MQSKDQVGSRSLGFVGFVLMVALMVSGPVTAAVIVVTSTADDTATNGNCTLREAILSAGFDFGYDACTAGLGADTVLVPTGYYALSIAGEDDIGLLGDLDIFTEMTVAGYGADLTVIDAQSIDRVFDIQVADADIKGMTIRGGQTSLGGRGGCVRIEDESGSAGTQEVLIEEVRFESCQADGEGGGLSVRADDASVLTIRESGFSDCGTGSLFGGLLYVEGSGGEVVIERSSFTAPPSGGQDCMYLTGFVAGEILTATVRSSTVAGCADLGIVTSYVDLTLDFVTLADNSPSSLFMSTPGGVLNMTGTILDSFDCPSTSVSFTSGGDNLFVVPFWTCGEFPSQPTDTGVGTIGELRISDELVASGSWRPSLPPFIDSFATDGGQGPCPALDQDGRVRPRDNDGDGQARCTFGAVETILTFPFFEDDFESGDTTAWSETVGG